MTSNRQITLARRPAGLPTLDDFQMVNQPLRELTPGQVLIQTIYLSVDPYMRGRMNDRKSYADPVGLGEVMTGGVVGRVTASRNDRFHDGDIVEGLLGWQEFSISEGIGLRRVDPELAPISTALGVLGMPGMTAYFGLLDVCHPVLAGETVLVSGAAGAVGSVVGQIAKIHDCCVYGIAGSSQKVEHMTSELGFDGGFNYKASNNYAEELDRLCPTGVDIYYDNVGGAITDAAIPRLKLGGRVAICGQISQYNLEVPEQGPRQLWHLIVKRAKIQGFLIFDFADRYQEALEQLGGWVRAGKIKYFERITDGIENAPQAFIEMLQGYNIGKQLVRVGE